MLLFDRRFLSMTIKLWIVAYKIIAAVWATAMIPISIGAQTVSISISSQKDNTLYEDPAGALSNGSGYYLFAGRNSQLSNSIRRGAIQFDIAANIPSGAVIVDADLTLYMSRTSFGPATIELHRLLAGWGEGTSDAAGEEGGGALSTMGDATWIHTIYNTSFWTQPGGDFSAGVSSSAIVDAIGFYTFGSTSAMVADIQSWLDNPGGNFGWVVIGNEIAGGSSKRFDAKENSTVMNRPVLKVFFTQPTCCILNRGDINNDGSVNATILDLNYLVNKIFRGGPPPVCALEADVNSDGTFANILDLNFLVNKIFRGGAAPGPC